MNFGGATLNDWRLPETWEDTINLSRHSGYEGDPDDDGNYNYRYGYNMDLSSEMARLYYDQLGNKGYCATDGTEPQSGWGLVNKGPLTALEDAKYWSGTEYSSIPIHAWYFDFNDGYQHNLWQKGYNGYHALAVLPGNVAAAVPVPGAIWLLGSGLAGLIGLRRKISRR